MAWKATATALVTAAAVVGLAGAPAGAAREQGTRPQVAAQPTPPESAETVARRQETMRQMEAIWLLLDDMVRRQGADMDRKPAVEGAEALAGLFAQMQKEYPEGSFGPQSGALPAVRQDWPAFLQLAEAAEGHAIALREAFAQGSEAEARDALSALERDCSACHLRFSPGIRTDLRPWPQGRP